MPTPIPIPSPNARLTCHRLSARLARISPPPTTSEPTATIQRGPKRSDNGPNAAPSPKNRNAAIENTSDTDAREAPKSDSKLSKNVPNE